MSANKSVSARTTRLNKLIVGQTDVDRLKQASCTLNRETLLDAFTLLYNECNKDNLKKNDSNIFEFTKKYRDVIAETKQLRVNIDDFSIKCLIGKGFFGDVHLAHENITHDVYAIKKIPKSAFAHAREERNIMAINNSEWLPALQYAFQDQTNLYLVMEFLPGGDLLNLMIRNGTFSEELIKFYLAEITVALNALHSMGYVHRDIKPENILLDRFGHLKLADFGSAAMLDKEGHVISFSPVGTPDYIAPELLQPISTKKSMKTIYNETCDFWSMGIIGYELITETTPFHSDNVNDTYSQILSFCDGKQLQHLRYPRDTIVSTELSDLIDSLVTEMDKRFSYDQIINHSFFSDIDWSSLRHQVPPIIPSLSGDDDTSHFDEEIKKSRRNNTYNKTTSIIQGNNFSGQDLPFIGYGYVHEEAHPDTIFPVSNKTEVNRLSNQVKSLQKKITTQMVDIGSLQQNLTSYECKSAQMDSVEKILALTKDELNELKTNLKDKTVEIATCKTEIKKLKNSLKIELEMRTKNDANITDVLNSTYQKWERVKKLSDQNYEKQIAEKNTEIMSMKQNLKVCEKELETKSAECVQLQETIEHFKELLKSSKNQNSNDKHEYMQKQRETTEHYENQIKSLKAKLQQQIDAKHSADDEIQRSHRNFNDKTQTLKLISDHKEKLDQTNKDLNRRLNQEIDENKTLRSEKRKVEQQLQELQTKLDEMNKSINRRASASEGIDGCASVYCSLESLSSSLEEQLKKDLMLAKESENEQRLRANRLEEAVNRLETAIESLGNQSVTKLEEVFERKNEKLEDKLNALREQIIIEKQSANTANLAKWRLERDFKTLEFDKTQLESQIKKVKTEKEDLEKRFKENRLTARGREEKINELQTEIASIKAELTAERKKWDSSEKERNDEKAEIVKLNATIHKLDVDLDRALIKMRIFEQEKNSLASKNEQLMAKLSKENDQLHDAVEEQKDWENKYTKLSKDYNFLKIACAAVDTQCVELEAKYHNSVDQNTVNCKQIDKLWENIRGQESKMLKLQQELSEEKMQKTTFDRKSSDLEAELDKVTDSLNDCHARFNKLNHELMEKTNNLMHAEELIEVQKEKIRHLQQTKHSAGEELRIMKEQNTKILTELHFSKDAHNKHIFEYNNLKDNFHDLKKELDQLNGTMREMNNYNVQREIKSEATISQYKKLIDYLQKRVDELSQKKKKTLAEVLFGSGHSSKKENLPPNSSTATELQDQLKRERIRNSQIKSQTLKNSSETKTVVRRTESTPYKKPIEVANSNSMHHFELTLQSNGTNNATPVCSACRVPFLNGNSFWQCRKCTASVHRKCRGDVKMNCSEGGSVSTDFASSETSSSQRYPAKSEYAGEMVLREDISSPPLKVNCLIEIVENILLLGCSSGLKAYNLNTEKLVHVANIEAVNYIATVSSFHKCLMIGFDGNKLLQCDLRQLQTRAQATVCLNSGLDYIDLDLPLLKHASMDVWQFVKIFDYMESDHTISDPIAIAGTLSEVVILKYHIESKCFKAIRSLHTAQPVLSVLFTPHTAIVSSDKFFEIDLNSFGAEEFLDLSDKTILHALKSKPMEAFKINEQEYLLCFKDFGIFCDEFGCRSRPNDIKWLKTPTAFAYRHPILFIANHSDGVQIMRINKSHSNEMQMTEDESSDAMLQTFISLHKVRIAGNSGQYGIFTLSTMDNGIRQILKIEGTKALRNALSDSMETIISNETEL